MRQPIIGADGTIEIIDAPTSDEKLLVDRAVEVFGEELASALDEGRVVAGDVAYAKTTQVVTIAGKPRQVTLQFMMQDH